MRRPSARSRPRRRTWTRCSATSWPHDSGRAARHRRDPRRALRGAGTPTRRSSCSARTSASAARSVRRRGSSSDSARRASGIRPSAKARSWGWRPARRRRASRPVVEVMFSRLHHARDGPAREPCRQAALHDRRAAARAARHPGPGRGDGAMGAHHSQSLEAWFTHVPGLLVVPRPPPPMRGRSCAPRSAADDPVVYPRAPRALLEARCAG